MNAHRKALAARRQALVLQAQAQRTALRADLTGWQRRLSMVDRGLRVGQFLRRHPLLVISGVLALAALRPTRFGIWVQRGWIASRLLYGPILR